MKDVRKKRREHNEIRFYYAPLPDAFIYVSFDFSLISSHLISCLCGGITNRWCWVNIIKNFHIFNKFSHINHQIDEFILIAEIFVAFLMFFSIINKHPLLMFWLSVFIRFINKFTDFLRRFEFSRTFSFEIVG